MAIQRGDDHCQNHGRYPLDQAVGQSEPRRASAFRPAPFGRRRSRDPGPGGAAGHAASGCGFPARSNARTPALARGRAPAKWRYRPRPHSLRPPPPRRSQVLILALLRAFSASPRRGTPLGSGELAFSSLVPLRSSRPPLPRRSQVSILALLRAFSASPRRGTPLGSGEFAFSSLVPQRSPRPPLPRRSQVLTLSFSAGGRHRATGGDAGVEMGPGGEVARRIGCGCWWGAGRPRGLRRPIMRRSPGRCLRR